MQDHAQERLLDRDSAVVFDEPQLAELVHEEVDARARRADHLGEDLLRQIGDHPDGRVIFPVASQQQQRTGETLLAGIEELVDQILLNPNVSAENVGKKAI